MSRYDLGREELAALLQDQPAYRQDQVRDGLYRRLCEPEEMTELPRELRRRLGGAPEMALAFSVVTESVAEALEWVNLCAPEHLELLVDEPMALLGLVRHAGAIFLGPWSPEPLGDYVAGPSHVLPTGGTARFASPIGVETFSKRSSLIGYGPATLRREAEAIVCLARAEGLEAHARSVEARID